VGDVLLAADRWPTNGHLIADVLDLYVTDGYIAAADVTWGRGLWWTRADPETRFRFFERHDLKLDGVDFRNLPHPDAHFHLVAFDPPYVCTGGRKTSTLASKKAPEASPDEDQPADFLDRYGLFDAPRTPAGVQDLINAGLTEVHRVLDVDGLALVKCKDYIWSGRLFPGTHYTLTHALNLGFELVDRFEHIGNPGPQPADRKSKTCRGEGYVPPWCVCTPTASHRWDPAGGCPLVTNPRSVCPDCSAGKVPRQVKHARRNLSTLFVFRKTKRTRITVPPLPTSTTEAPR
jgi:hypothetical protein